MDKTRDETLENGMPMRGHVMPIYEWMYRPPAQFVRIPDDCFLFRGWLPDPHGLVDQGYVLRGNYHYWSLWEQENDEWLQLPPETWSYHHGAPHYVLTWYISDDDLEDIVSPYEDVQMRSVNLWIEDEAVLRIFLDQFPLNLEGPGQEAHEQSIIAEMMEAALKADFPSPLDYLYKYWRHVSPDDRLRFLVEMLTPNERRSICLGLDEED